MASIKGAHIFETGTWNGINITVDTLDSLVSSFAALANAGRVPLKLGHNDEQSITDGQPALGWVDRVYRKGSSLFADFSGLPGAVYDSIKKGLYKFVSIEMLRNVDSNGQRYDAVLDAVALLGADRPAVTSLADLQRLAATRAERPMVFESVEAFSLAFALPDDEPRAKGRKPVEAEVARLRTERDDFARRADVAEKATADLRRKIDAETFARKAEDYVRSGRVTPATRDLILKRLKDPATAQAFSATDLLDSMAMPPGTHGYVPGLVVGKVLAPGGDSLDNPVAELSLATREYAKQNGVDVFTAMGAVARLRRDLVEPLITQFCRARGR